MEQGKDRRNETRLLCADLVQLSWYDDAGHDRRRVANLEDISLKGLCVQTESALPIGTRVNVSYGDGTLVGIVRYCAYRDLGYFIGVELEEGCRWSTQHYRPEHLLDPSELVERALSRYQLADQSTVQ